MLATKLFVLKVNLVMSANKMRHLQQHFKERIRSNELLKKYFEDCNVSPPFDRVKISGKEKFEKLLTFTMV